MTDYLRVSEALAIAGAADYSFVTDEGKWKGSETHRAAELLDRGRLRKTPEHIQGRLHAYTRFKIECHFVPDPDGIELSVRLAKLRLVGRADRKGMLRGKPALLEIKSGPIQAAAALQLCLYGDAIDSRLWWARIAVELRDDGTYRATKFDRENYHSDLLTARACVRLAQWKMQHGLYRRE